MGMNACYDYISVETFKKRIVFLMIWMQHQVSSYLLHDTIYNVIKFELCKNAVFPINIMKQYNKSTFVDLSPIMRT